MRPLLRCVLVPVSYLLLGGCAGSSGDGGDGEGAPPVRGDGNRAGATALVLHPVEVRGGTPIEGFIAAYDVDPIDRRGIDGVQYDGMQRVALSPGRVDVRVIFYPCDSICGTWDDLADQYDAQLAEGRTPPVDEQLVRCAGTVQVAAGDEVELTPVVQVGGPDAATCELLEGEATGSQSAAG